MTHTVRVTMRPDVEFEVGDAEYTDLERQGLLVEDTKKAAKTATKDKEN